METDVTTTLDQLSDLAAEATVCAERPPLVVTSPLNGLTLGAVPAGTPDDVALAGERARRAASQWAAWPVQRRCAVIARYRDLLVTQREELLDLVHAENGKARVAALEEYLDAVLTAGYYAKFAPRHLAPQRRRGALPTLTSTRVAYQPKGVVGIITPWNYPLTLVSSDAVAALAAGNAVILKPDSQTPLTALALLRLARQAGLPRDVFQIVTGAGATLGEPLLDQVDHLMFTGSTATGRVLAEQCGRRLISCAAELGGKNALLVLADAPLQRAVDGAVQACFSNTGQICAGIERVYVHKDVYDAFKVAFVAKAKALRLGTGPGYDVDLGPLINQAQLEKVQAHVADAVAKGAKVLTGGEVRDDIGPLFFEPTVLVGVTDQMKLAREETFGPVVALYQVADDAEAIARANDTDYGLNAAVWSGSLAHGRAVAARLRSGGVNVNEGYAAVWGSTDAPFGGVGASGLGRRHGPEGIREYTEPQTVAAQRLMPAGQPPWLSRETYAVVMTAAVHWLHVTGGQLLGKVMGR
ncbi:MAG: succinate-semialdehyde dehydrogenase (NADP(+)) [Bifidobacteriaceae bacterium]|jgi:succinate-semialdehyde dehydrogenase/glutarate-semialdehyde dehydrogenase|nr:succinate-semialdehyde dehydrogenase (NADP(+)) [Bifidobacteriaceae bacterium]